MYKIYENYYYFGIEVVFFFFNSIGTLLFLFLYNHHFPYINLLFYDEINANNDFVNISLFIAIIIVRMQVTFSAY